MSTPSPPQPGIFTLANVLGISTGVLMRNLGGFVILAILIQLGIYFINGALGVNGMGGSADPETRPPGVGFIGTAINLLGYSFLSAMVSYGTFRDLRGDRVGVGEVVTHGFRVLPPVVGVAIATVIIYVLGLFAFFVPALIAVVFLWVAVPAAVIERKGVIASLMRSVELTKGARWSIFGMLLLFGLAFAVVIVAVGGGAVITGVEGTMSEEEIEAAAGGPAQIAVLLFGMVLSLITSVAAAVSYFLLRSEKEGTALGDVGSVFD